MRRISLVAVLVGGIVDVGGSSLAGLPVVFYVITKMSIVGLSQAEQTAIVMTFIKSHVLLYVILAVIGTACTVVGGYVAAWIAKRSEVLNGALSSWLCLLLGISTLNSGSAQMPIWLFVALLPLSPLFAGLGGYLRLRHQIRRGHDQSSGVSSSAA